jgi:hypothetical protein
MANTYELIETKTITGGTNFTFSGIPSTYKDLHLLWSGKETYSAGGGAINFVMQFNGIATDYQTRNVYTYGASSRVSESPTTITLQGVTGARLCYGNNSSFGAGQTGLYSSGSLYVPNYASNKNKAWSCDTAIEDNNTLVNTVFFSGGVWTYSGSPAISSITIGTEVGTFISPSTFYLYGIK